VQRTRHVYVPVPSSSRDSVAGDLHGGDFDPFVIVVVVTLHCVRVLQSVETSDRVDNSWKNK